jgi:hypothetical protein
MDWSNAPIVLMIPVPIITFILGFFASRWTMTKKERADVSQKQFENAKSLMEAQNATFQEFTAALHKYANKKGKPSLTDFFDISTAGERYFYQQKITCDAILSDKVDASTRDNTLVPKIKESVERTLPDFYKTLQSIAGRREIEYEGTLKRSNYESMYAVVEKYGNMQSGAA